MKTTKDRFDLIAREKVCFKNVRKTTNFYFASWKNLLVANQMLMGHSKLLFRQLFQTFIELLRFQSDELANMRPKVLRRCCEVRWHFKSFRLRRRKASLAPLDSNSLTNVHKVLRKHFFSYCFVFTVSKPRRCHKFYVSRILAKIAAKFHVKK